MTVSTHCSRCGCSRTFAPVRRQEARGEGLEAERINPTDRPSRIVDLSQWLSLFHMLLESAASEPSPPAARLKGYRAALCLTEALKFYGDDELPPETAFFSQTTLDIFRQHPEKFARQRLRDMQAKLPSLPKMARQVVRDDRAKGRRWWQFWRRRIH